jgi:hypothetical protein
MMDSGASPGPLDLVTVFATSDPVLLATAKVVLESGGVPFLAKGEGVQDLIGLGRVGGLNLAAGPVQIQVPHEHAVRALTLLEEVE